MLHALSRKTRNTVKNITWSELNHPSLSKRLSESTRQDLGMEHSILLSVTHMLCVIQVCHAVNRCVKDGSCSLSSLEWKLMGYRTISTNVRRYQTHHRWNFSFRKTAHCCKCIVHATQSNFCGALDFLSPEPCPPTASSSAHWLQDLGSHTAAWVWVVSQKDWKNQGGTSWILEMH